jgi:1,4-dihydroxy-2-naphthoyl-CoA hydrolase
VETVASYAAALRAGPDAIVVDIDLNASYLQSATSGAVTAVCTPVGDEKSPLSTFLIEVLDDAGRLTASARLTCMARPARRS